MKDLEWVLANPNERQVQITGLGIPMTRPSLHERLAANTNRGHPEECWPWTGSRRSTGYGLCFVAGERLSAHRLVFRLGHGFFPPVVRHRCDWPLCVNLDHLEGGTKADNNRDTRERGRHKAPRPRPCPPDHVTVKRWSDAKQLMVHICKTCRARQARERRNRNKLQGYSPSVYGCDPASMEIARQL